MTIFSDNPHDRRIERFMTAIPNFKPRGVGVRFSESQILITVTAATPTEILVETMRQIRCPPFRKRFNEYIESEEKPMTYINEKHRARFELAAKNIAKTNYALLSALYLLTADQRLWGCCKHHINNGGVFFENIKLNNCTERAYTLYCAAKDLTLGTKHITVSDLSDADLVPPMLFRTICNAMAIRRFGLAAMVAELIDHIEVYHAEKQDGVTNQRVVIYYNCIGSFDVPDRRKIPEADIIMETRKGVALSYAPEQVAV